MKNLSKVLAVVLAFAMALSMVSFAAYSDIEAGADCEEAVTVLSALGVLSGYEDGTFKPEATITRAEFASVVIRMLGYGDIAGGGVVIYTDVPADHWANGVIALASQQGIISGYGNGAFGPNDPVTVEQATAMVVRALGYTPMADANGGYPGGFQVVAAQRGILANCSYASTTAPATRGTVAQMVYNSLTVPMMEQNAYGTNVSFGPSKNTALTKLGVAKVEGEVTNTKATKADLNGKVEVKYKRQYVALGGTDYGVYAIDVTDTDYSKTTNLKLAFGAGGAATINVSADVEKDAIELIDANSIMYIKDGSSTKSAKLICVLEDADSNKTVEFASEDINDDETTATSTGTLAVYTDADKDEYDEYELAIDKVYINGRSEKVTLNLNTDDDADIEIAYDANIAGNEEAIIAYFLNSGVSVDIKLMSTEEDKWTKLYITSYVDGVVSSVTPAVDRVKYTSGGTTKTVVLDADNKAYSFKVYKDGEEATINDIAENDVISIAGYVNSEFKLVYGNVYVSSKKLEGKVTGTRTGVIYVDGVKYDSVAAETVKAGDSATFYLNARGVIIGLDKTQSKSNIKYGFASYINVDKFGEAQIRMLTSDGVWATFEVAEKLEYVKAGPTVETVKETSITWTNLLGVNAKYNGQSDLYAINDVVVYELNSNGEIDALYTDSYAGEYSKFAAASYTAGDEGKYNKTMSTLAGKDVDDTTVVFSVPTAVYSSVFADGTTTVNDVTIAKKAQKIDEEDVTVVALSSLAHDKLYAIDGIYNVDEDTDIVGAVLGVNMVGDIDWTDRFFVVTDIMDTANAEDEEGTLVTGLVAGEEATLFIPKDVDAKKATFTNASTDVAISGTNAADLAKGDIILYTLDAKGEAAKVVVLMDASAVSTDSDTAYGKLARPAGLVATTVLGTLDTSDGVDYRYIFGYVTGENKGKYTINNTAAVGGVEYRFASEADGAVYDAYVGSEGKVAYAVSGNLIADTGDSSLDENGDMIFAKVNSNDQILDFVIFSNDR